jgi:signal transduction histidine kinase
MNETQDTTEARLEEMGRRIEQTQRLVTLGTLAAGVAHEINNILTPVLSYAHLAKSRPEDTEMQEKALRKIVSGVTSACEVAQATLNYSKDDDERSTADVAETIHEAMGCLAREPEKDGITLATRVAPATLVQIRPLSLQQVLLNLILNARAAIKGRQGTISIEAVELPDEATRITVSDDGPGIPPAILENLFEPFVTTGAGRQAATLVGGAGLGLTVTKHLIERAGGSIVATSSDQGAMFEIVLPTARPVRAKAG